MIIRARSPVWDDALGAGPVAPWSIFTTSKERPEVPSIPVAPVAPCGPRGPAGPVGPTRERQGSQHERELKAFVIQRSPDIILREIFLVHKFNIKK